MDTVYIYIYNNNDNKVRDPWLSFHTNGWLYTVLRIKIQFRSPRQASREANSHFPSVEISRIYLSVKLSPPLPSSRLPSAPSSDVPPLLGALENRARRPPPSCRAPTPPTLTVFHRFREINISLIYFAYYSNIPPSYYSRPPFPIPFSREVNLLLLPPPSLHPHSKYIRKWILRPPPPRPPPFSIFIVPKRREFSAARVWIHNLVGAFRMGGGMFRKEGG